MDFYEIFYWISVADGLKSFFDVASNIFTFLCLLSFVFFVIMKITIYTEKKEDSVFAINKASNIIFVCMLASTLITWCGYVFIPTKKDCVMIIAAGGTLEFLSNDSTAKTIPAHVLNWVSKEIQLLEEETKIELNKIKTDTVKPQTKDTQLLEEVLKNEEVQKIILKHSTDGK